MARPAALERRLATLRAELHDHLWTGRRQDESKLLGRIADAVEQLDRRIRARGSVRAAVRPLVRDFHAATVGADLYTFLAVASDLSAAVECADRAPRKAAKLASDLAVSLSIHLASAAGRFDFVDAFETGKTDFSAFTSALADALEERGVIHAGELRRSVNAAFDVNAVWDEHDSRDLQKVAALTGIVSAAFASCLLVEALRSLGKYRDPPYGRLIPIVRKILEGLGGHP